MIRIASYNIKVTLSDRLAGMALRALTTYASVICLQEFGGKGRPEILRRLRRAGWHYYRPTHGPVVVWDNAVWEKVGGHALLLAKGRHVGFTPGRRSYLPDYVATVVYLRHRKTGVVHCFINVHTPAHVEIGWTVALRPGGRSVMYREAIRAVSDKVRSCSGPVHACGDWNYHLAPNKGFLIRTLRGVGLTSMWAKHRPSRGTLGGRVVDGIFSTSTPIAALVLPGFDLSDHKPVVGIYPTKESS